MRMGDALVAYHSEVYGDGEVCDLTGRLRRTEVRYVCDPGAVHTLASVEETSTCAYRVVVHTSLLCANPAYGAAAEAEAAAVKCLPAGETTAPEPAALTERREADEAEAAARRERERQEQLVRVNQRKERKQREKALKESQPLADAGAKGRTAGREGGSKAPTGAPETSAKRSLKVKEDGAGTVTLKDSEMARKLIRNFINGGSCFTGGGGWWKYEVCYKKHVLQYHIDADGSRTDIVLGRWDEEYHRGQVQAGKKAKTLSSVVHFYGGGSFCEEADAPRTVKVLMSCSTKLKGSQLAVALEERETCKYTLKVQSGLFCDVLDAADRWGTIDSAVV